MEAPAFPSPGVSVAVVGTVAKILLKILRPGPPQSQGTEVLS